MLGMDLALTEVPLALFSTLAPMGAGAFTLLAVAFFTGKFDDAELKRIDRLTVIPLLFVLAGFICAFFHLANPAHSIGVFANVGSSPLSNEIVVGMVFCVVAIIYWIVAIATRMSDGLRKGFCTVTALVGLVFCVFVGLAYGMDTIPSWASATVPMSTLFYGILGGAAVGMTVLYSADSYSPSQANLNLASLITSWVGVAGSAIFLAWNMGNTSTLSNNMMSGSDMVGAIMPWVITAIIIFVLAGIALTFEIRKRRANFYAWIVTIVVFAGILIARLSFYGIELSAGLGI